MPPASEMGHEGTSDTDYPRLKLVPRAMCTSTWSMTVAWASLAW
jgi:hypothetical protein